MKTALLPKKWSVNITDADWLAQPWIGWTMAIVAILSFSSNAPLGRAAIVAGVSPTHLLIIRYFFSVLTGAISFLFTDASILKIGWPGIRRTFVVGIFSFGTTFTFYWGLAYVNVSMATMLISLYPLFVLIPLALMGEKALTPRNITRLAIGLVGLYLLLGPGGGMNWTGLMYLSACIIGYAVYLILLQRTMQGYNSRATSFYTDVTLLVLLSAAGLIEGQPMTIPTTRILGLIFMMGVIGTFVARNLTFQAVKRIGSGQYALLGPLDTILTIMWSVLFLQETLSTIQWAGGLLILISATLAVELKPGFARRFLFYGKPTANKQTQ